VSVSLANSTPGRPQLGAQAAKFSMMPLWTTATRPSASQVRVGVAVGRAAVGGPPGVPDAGGAAAGSGRSLGQRLLQVGELAGLLLGQRARRRR
jgi:hypothetical protein